MRWGRKKPVSSSEASSGLSHAVAVSWLSKFSKMGIGGSDLMPAKHRKQDVWLQRRCYDKSGDDLERSNTRKESNLQSVSYEEICGLDLPATCMTSESTSGNKCEEMMNKVRKIRREKGTTMITTPRHVQRWERRDQMLLEQKPQARRSMRQINDPSLNIGGRSRVTEPEDSVFLTHDVQKAAHQWRKLKETKLQEVKQKAEQQRKSMYIWRELNRFETKEKESITVFSPRASSVRAEKFRVKAIEGLKKAKARAREHKARATGRIEKESVSVVKCSRDPQKDFRDSMIEMISENCISRAEELRELLLCYLTLNADEYHYMIIKVFREVWSELKHFNLGHCKGKVIFKASSLPVV